VSVAEFPLQIAVGELEAVTVGLEFTITEIVLVFKHPAALTPVTEYVVVMVGLTTTLEATVPIGFQVYVVAPVAESVTDPTTQIAVGEAVAFTVGFALTTSATVLVLVQPNPLAPVSVYVVELAGETVTALPVKEPGSQV
jgi:hypothetical protein